jgi:hypothetical protein
MEPDAEQRVLVGDRIARALDNPWVVLALLFFVFAAVGIPLIWISKAFSRWAKVVVTIVIVLYTAAILWLFWLVMLWSYQRIVDSL